MRIWDVPAGYLNRQSLLGEHRELHGLYNILSKGKKGYSRHPETLRWVGALSGLTWRHAQLRAEMALRGYTDRSPLPLDCSRTTWPKTFVTEPVDQFSLLREKYVGKEVGRIHLPRNAQELWAQHKYSVMARDPDAYRDFGRAVARMHKPEATRGLARELVAVLRRKPAKGRLANALDHMWGHVREAAGAEEKQAALQGPTDLFNAIQNLAMRRREKFLLSSTALSELAVYLEEKC